jgi:hypothetical protein
VLVSGKCRKRQDWVEYLTVGGICALRIRSSVRSRNWSSNNGSREGDKGECELHVVL